MFSICFVICGGGDKIHDCNIIDENGLQAFKMSSKNGRQYASSIKLNDTTMWITGGLDSNDNRLYSTEFVTVNGSSIGPNIPFRVLKHCMVQFKPNGIMLIGGRQNDDKYSARTWIIDLGDNFSVIEGPTLKKGRESHSCGKIIDENGHVHVVVAGGYKIDSVEFLDTSLMNNWTKGKNSLSENSLFG